MMIACLNCIMAAVCNLNYTNRTNAPFSDVSVKGMTVESFNVLLKSVYEGLTSATRSLRTHAPDSATSMSKAVSFLADSTAWLVREGGCIHDLGIAAACEPLREVTGQVLSFALEAAFSESCFEALGSSAFKSCCVSICASLKDLSGMLTRLLCSWWKDQETLPLADIMKCQAMSETLISGLQRLGVMGAGLFFDSKLEVCAVPEERVNLALAGVAWTALVNVCACSGSPKGLEKSELMDGAQVVDAMRHILKYLGLTIRHSLWPKFQDSSPKMLKFWATNLVKLAGSCGDGAVYTCFSDLVRVLIEGHCLMAAQCWLPQPGPPRPGSDQVHQVMEGTVSGKLASVMLICLEAAYSGREDSPQGMDESHWDAILEMQVEPPAICPSAPPSPPARGRAREETKEEERAAGQTTTRLARLSLVTALLHCAPLLGSAPLLLGMSKRLLPWLLVQASTDLPVDLSKHPLDPSTPLGRVCSGTIALVMANEAQAASGSCTVADEASRECMDQLYMAGCDPHPTLQLVASASLSCILSSLKPEEAAAHLTGLGRLVSDLAAPEAAADLGALLQRAAGQGPGPRGAAGERGADDGAEGNRRATMGASSSSTSGILADCSPSNPESWACRAALLLSTLMKTVTHNEAISTAVTNLGLSDRPVKLPPPADGDDTSDAGGTLGRALLLHAAAGRIGATDTALWLQRLTAQSNQLITRLAAFKVGSPGEPCSPSDVPPAPYMLTSVHLAALLACIDACALAAIRLIEAHPAEQAPTGSLGSLEADLAAAAQVAADALTSTPPQDRRRHHLLLPHLGGALRVVARAGGRLTVATLRNLIPHLEDALSDPDPKHASHVAVALRHYSNVDPIPATIFHSLLESSSPVLRHEAILSMVSVCRSCPPGAFKALRPPGLFSHPDSGLPTKLGHLFTAYLTNKGTMSGPGGEARLRDATARGSAGSGWKIHAGQDVGSLRMALDDGIRFLKDVKGSGASRGEMVPAATAQLLQLLPQIRTRVTATSASLATVESDLHKLVSFVRSGEPHHQALPEAAGDVRAQVHAHALQVQAELSSLVSRIRSLQELAEGVRAVCR